MSRSDETIELISELFIDWLPDAPLCRPPHRKPWPIHEGEGIHSLIPGLAHDASAHSPQPIQQEDLFENILGSPPGRLKLISSPVFLPGSIHFLQVNPFLLRVLTI